MDQDDLNFQKLFVTSGGAFHLHGGRGPALLSGMSGCCPPTRRPTGMPRLSMPVPPPRAAAGPRTGSRPLPGTRPAATKSSSPAPPRSAGWPLKAARLAGLPPRSVLAGRTSLATLAARTASARLVISGDTGMAHLATACARPSVTLFGPSRRPNGGRLRTPAIRCCGAARTATGVTRTAARPTRRSPPSRCRRCSLPRSGRCPGQSRRSAFASLSERVQPCLVPENHPARAAASQCASRRARGQRCGRAPESLG
jgi:hypothetical protein